MAALRSLEVELEAVTPLWIGGASRQAELRPPSVRGALRFWFRALAGGLMGESLSDIAAAEGAVFGNTFRSSAVVVRLFGSPRIGVSVADDAAQLPGLSYMFWSVFQQKRDAILPGERFRLRLNLRPYPFPAVEVAGRTLEMADSFELAAAALWLFLRLGGVGARTRRGAGGARAVAAPADWPARLPSLVTNATTPAELAAELSAGLKQVRQFAGWQGPPPANPSSYDILHERVCQLYLAERTFPTWWEAVNWAGETFHAFRVEHKLDASGIAALLTQGRIAVRTIERAMLGLPIGFFFKSIYAELTGRGVDSREARRKASASVAPGRGLGRASPMFFRVVPLTAPGTDLPAAYAVLMGVFRSVLVPDHELTVKPGDFSLRPQRLEAPRDYAVFDRWFDHVRAQGVGLSPITLS
jgi:CRISPR-associated protein Cmr1